MERNFQTAVTEKKAKEGDYCKIKREIVDKLQILRLNRSIEENINESGLQIEERN